MKIGVLTQWFPPEGATLVWDLCEALVQQGHTVKVLTGFPNYPTGVIYDGYRQRWNHYEVQEHVLVRRVPLYPSHDASASRRAANYLTFVGTSTAASGFLADCDVIYVYATPMSVGVAAAALHLVRGLPYVLHVQDLWPDSVIESNMVGAPWVRRMMTVLINSGLKHLYRNAAHVIAIAPTMRKLLHERGVPPDKTSVVLNWSPIAVAPSSGIDPMVRRMLGRAARTLAVFAGTIGTVQDVETIVRAAALCRHEVPLDVAVIGAGTGADSARRLATDLGADNVRFIGPLGVSEMPGVYAASDYQLVTLKNRPAFHGTIPSKLGAALAHGSPIITTVPGDVTDMCESGRFGFSAAPEDPEALAGTFSRACATSSAERKRMSCAARDFYETNMSKKSAVDAVQSILADVARR